MRDCGISKGNVNKEVLNPKEVNSGTVIKIGVGVFIHSDYSNLCRCGQATFLKI